MPPRRGKRNKAVSNEGGREDLEAENARLITEIATLRERLQRHEQERLEQQTPNDPEIARQRGRPKSKKSERPESDQAAFGTSMRDNLL